MPTVLPIDRFLPEIIANLRRSRSLVLVAPPGAGKTTRVPPAIVREDILSRDHPKLVMLQPRRVAARAAAMRIAEENNWKLGEQVGYHVRFDKHLSQQTRLRVLTEGILTRQLVSDPFLEGIGAVLLDEFHERSLHTDIAIALLREVQQTVRPDLVLVVMSATLEAEPVAKFLGNCPIVRAEGRTFPIEIEHEAHGHDPLPQRAADAVARAVHDPSARGDILVFLPGVEEIHRTAHRLESLAQEQDLMVLPLHGSLSSDDQLLALRPSPNRKVILATNIAETSLTIDGVRTVIDTGLARIASYDPQRGLDRLDLHRISKASATQRAGRAGRTGPGKCIRLWSIKEHHALTDFQEPEVRRVDLAATVLSLHAWGKSDPRAFAWYDPPAEEMLVAAERLLALLGALSETNGAITPLGKRMLALPIHPRLGRLMLAAIDENLALQGATLSALLSEKDVLLRPPERHSASLQGNSDLLLRADWLKRAEKQGFSHHLRDQGIDPIAARGVIKLRDELLRVCKQNRHSDIAQEADHAASDAMEERLLKLLLVAYPDRVARRRDSDPNCAVGLGGGGLRLAEESIVRQGEFFITLDARKLEHSKSNEALVRVASRVEEPWLEELFPRSIRREKVVEFDPQRQAVVGRRLTWFGDLLIREESDSSLDPEKAGSALGEALRPRAGEIFRSDPAAASWLARLALLRTHMPEHAWPALDDEALGDLLAQAAMGKRSLEQITRAGMVQLLQSRIVYPLDRLFEQHAPEAIVVPTGNRIRLDYASGPAPILAVRLQEIFGLTQTPRIAGGRISVLLHLLGPNYRPVQITDDLESFWRTTYFQVRKDLRARYPKHSWPEDPLSAKPVAKGRSHR